MTQDLIYPDGIAVCSAKVILNSALLARGISKFNKRSFIYGNKYTWYIHRLTKHFSELCIKLFLCWNEMDFSMYLVFCVFHEEHRLVGVTWATMRPGKKAVVIPCDYPSLEYPKAKRGILGPGFCIEMASPKETVSISSPSLLFPFSFSLPHD